MTKQISGFKRLRNVSQRAKFKPEAPAKFVGAPASLALQA